MAKGQAEIKTGPFGTQLHASDYVEQGTPVINARNIGFGDIRPEKLEFISVATVNRLSSHLLRPEDIVFGRKGTVERHSFIRREHENWFQGTDCLRLRLKGPLVDPRFVSYSFLTDSHKQWIVNQSSHGATMTSLNQDIIGRIKLRVPPLPTQRKIAAILSAYDDLIENNTRRIKILEGMARALYREWFVCLRFPGHEKFKLVASPLGNIPQGWEVKKLSEYVSTKYGYTESANTEPVGPKYLRGMDINKTSYIDWSEVPYCPITPEDHSAYRLKLGDVVVIRMADPGKVGVVEQEVDAVFASYLIRVAPTDSRLSPYFLFYLMESAEYYGYITGASTGTTRKSASAGVIADYQLVLPPQEVVTQFERRVTEIRLLLTTLLKQTVNLRSTRDLLLPKLISGEIDVGRLGINTAGSESDQVARGSA
ncbi:MAG: restriction endonuclease subunit S [Terriglobia bacterium]